MERGPQSKNAASTIGVIVPGNRRVRSVISDNHVGAKRVSDRNVRIGDAHEPHDSMECAGNHVSAVRPVVGSEVADDRVMSFAAVVDRVRADFMEMPGLELTMPQAVRLWTIGADDCRFVIDTLVDAGFLKWTARRTIVRTGAAFRPWPERDVVNIPVRSNQKNNKTVRNG
jgi:hypothetical protein